MQYARSKDVIPRQTTGRYGWIAKLPAASRNGQPIPSRMRLRFSIQWTLKR